MKSKQVEFHLLKTLFVSIFLFFLLSILALPAYSQLFNKHLFPVQVDGKWGYINNKGELEIEATYEMGYPFSDGYALVRDDGEIAVIDTNGEKVFIPEEGYFVGEKVTNGMLGYRCIHGESFYNLKKGEYLPPKFDMVRPFSGDLAAFRDKTNKRYGFINKEGEIVIQPQYETCGNFQNEMCAVRFDGKWGFIKKDGRFNCLNIYTYVKDYGDDLAAVWKFSNHIQYINKENEIIFTHQIYEDVNKLPSSFTPPIYGFSDGMVMVIDHISGLFGYKDKEGELAIRYQYKECSDFKDGLARVKYGDKWGFIDKKGVFKIAAEYDYVEDFENGLARVYRGGDAIDFEKNIEGVSMGYINKKGTLIWNYTH